MGVRPPLPAFSKQANYAVSNLALGATSMSDRGLAVVLPGSVEYSTFRRLCRPVRYTAITENSRDRE
jgi:hypothetical protein